MLKIPPVVQSVAIIMVATFASQMAAGAANKTLEYLGWKEKKPTAKKEKEVKEEEPESTPARPKVGPDDL